MSQAILTAVYLTIPLIFSGSLHMLVVSNNWFSRLAMPIHACAYGVNKTWRGVVVMMLATIPGVFLMKSMESAFPGIMPISLDGVNLALLGIALGLAYVVFELPNSYIKRRLNIKPGERSEKNPFVFTLMDQADSAIGCTLVYWLMISPPLEVCVWMIMIGPLIHIIANMVLYGFNLRKQPF